MLGSWPGVKGVARRKLRPAWDRKSQVARAQVEKSVFSLTPDVFRIPGFFAPRALRLAPRSFYLDSLPERKQGALEKAGVEGGLLQGVESAFDLIRLSSVLPGVFF
jgi:hypothetical protein